MTPIRPRRASAPAPDHEGAIAGAPYLRHRRVHRSRSHQRPRLLQLLATGGTGGAQESYTGLLLRLDRSKYEVRALSLSAGSAVQRIRRLGLPVDVIDEPDDEAAVRELAAWLRREEIDLVHAHMYRAEVVGTRAALAAGTPVIMATVHSSRVRSPEDQAALAALTPAMDRLIVPSASILAKVRSEGRGGAAFSVIPNGVDLSRFAAPPPACGLRRQYGVPPEGVLFGVVARLEPEKGHSHLLNAMPAILRWAPNAWLVACDGRHSLLREKAGLVADDFGAPMDVLWFRLSRKPDDSMATGGVFDKGRVFVMLNRGDYWQCALVIPKGSAEEVRRRGIEEFRAELARIEPGVADRVGEIADWKQVHLLTVTVNRLRHWHRPGLLCIGDAAHAMSPIGGVGINLAVQDAVAAANVLADPLYEKRDVTPLLPKVQERREFPTRATQRLQLVIQNNVIRGALRAAPISSRRCRCG